MERGESIFEKVYTFENVYEMYYTEAKDVLFLFRAEWKNRKNSEKRLHIASVTVTRGSGIWRL